MKKLFISAMLLVLISPISQADIHKCQFEDGRIYYYPDYEKRPDKCVTSTLIIVTPSQSEIDERHRKAVQQAEQEYRLQPFAKHY